MVLVGQALKKNFKFVGISIGMNSLPDAPAEGPSRAALSPSAVNCKLSTLHHVPWQNAKDEFRFSGFSRWNPGRTSSVRHRPDFFFDFRGIHHDDGVPRAAIEEAPVRAFAQALFAADAENWINLYPAKRRTILVRHPEHAVFDGAVFHTGGRSGAARTAFGDDGEFFRPLLAGGDDPLGARFMLQLVGHHPRGFDNFRLGRHQLRFYPRCQAFETAFRNARITRPAPTASSSRGPDFTTQSRPSPLTPRAGCVMPAISSPATAGLPAGEIENNEMVCIRDRGNRLED
jgi:hypothetical protein